MTGTLSPQHAAPFDPNPQATQGPPAYWQFWHDWIEPSGAHYWVPAIVAAVILYWIYRRRSRRQ